MGNLENLTLRSATRRIEGVSFPAIIHNGSYFLSDINVFEDGVVDCWGGVDLPLFKKKVSQGWVKTSMPDGMVLSAHHLAHMTIQNADWMMTPKTLVKRVKSIVKALNPTLTNLYDMRGDEIDRSGKVGMAKVNRTGNATWRVDGESAIFRNPIQGVTSKAFWRLDNSVNIVTVSLFNDDRIRITGAGKAEEMTLDALRQDDRLCTATKGDHVEIEGLGAFTLSDIEFTVPRDDFLAELEMNRDRTSGRQTSVSQTVAAFKDYKKNPTKESLEVLRAAYSSVPAHLRRYCGDMDSKDIPIRIALYGEDEIENWSHYAVAKSRGETLPFIRVPKVKDE
ncbi:MAG TPA: hypothetical protein EYG79_07730 [Rhodobacteraceae bacterium]|nr:hypothetical protein [Paracoccaceae bacterium]